MKKTLQLLWCWLALGVIFTLPIYFIAVGWDLFPYGIFVAVIPVLLAAIIALLLAKRNPAKWSRALAILYLSLMMTIVMAILVFFILTAFLGYPRPIFAWGIIPAAVIGLMLGILISRRGLWKSVGVLAALLVLAFGLIFALAERQKSIIRNYEREWKAQGISMEIKDLFPMPYSKPQCEAWFDEMARLMQNDKKAPWKAFYDEAAVPLSSEKNIEALAKGEDLRAVVLGLPASKDARWAQYAALSAEVQAAMGRCPHVQWFNPADYKDSIWKAPLPKLLALMKWARTQLGASQAEVAQGRMAEARASLAPVLEASKKMLIKGQPLINMLIGIAVQKQWLIGEAGVMAISGEPLDPETRSAVEAAAMQDLEWYGSSWLVEMYESATVMKMMPDPKSYGYGVDLPSGIPFRQSISRAMLYKDAQVSLYNKTLLFTAFKKVCHVAESKFGWADYHKITLKESIGTPNLTSIYGRALSLLAQSRLVLMMDEVLKYRRDHKALPENLDFVQASWRTDPFTEKPLIYKNEGDHKFLIYSPGPDMHDDGGTNLYVGGPMTFQDGKKEDMGFRIMVPS